MFIYECHMGGFYTSEHKLSFGEIYCEQCGDSDHLIGKANTAEEAWNLFKDDTQTQLIPNCDCICENENYNGECPHEKECFAQYSYGSVAEFISEDFADTIVEPIKMVLIYKDINYDNAVFAKFVKFKEKEEYEFPTLSTLDENITLHVWDLINLNDDYIEGSLKKVGTKKIDDTKYIFFEALSKEKEKINDFHYIDGFWYGFVPIKDAQPKFSKTTRNIYNAYLELKKNN